jgi:hypothetical protein
VIVTTTVQVPIQELGRISARRIHIAGSASNSADSDLLRYSHALVATIAKEILAKGGGLVVGVGAEPLQAIAEDALPLIFDWTVLEAFGEMLRSGQSYPRSLGPPLVVVCSESGEAKIPANRRELWRTLLRSGEVRVDRIRAGVRSGSMIREKQADFGDALVLIGGGAGVEHLADIYLERRKTVLPLNLAIGASREDGSGGSVRLYNDARANSQRYLRLDRSRETLAGTRLAELALAIGDLNVVEGSNVAIRILDEMDLPTAFYVRLLNRSHPQFSAVEAFFRSVVDPVVAEAGYRSVEMGRDRAENGFMNLEIFQSLHDASLAIVDVTGSRPNCFIELGYALGRDMRVLITAESGTEFPFDQEAIDAFLWESSIPPETLKTQLNAYWARVIDRRLLPNG